MPSTPGDERELELSAPARPEEIGSLRHALGEWLAGTGAGQDEVEDVSLAVDEALTNAVEHAYRKGEEGALAVSARRERDGMLAIVVRDFGHGDWSTPPALPGRGCGIGMMQRLMDSVEVSWTSKGTEIVLRRRLGRSGPPAGRWSRGDEARRARAPGP